MSDNDILTLARECGSPYKNRHELESTYYGFTEQNLITFARRIQAAERDRCAQLCAKEALSVVSNANEDYMEGREMGLIVAAAAIREQS